MTQAKSQSLGSEESKKFGATRTLRIHIGTVSERKKSKREQYENMHLDFPQSLVDFEVAQNLEKTLHRARGKTTAWKLKDISRNFSFSSWQGNRIWVQIYVLERFGKHLRLSIEAPEEPCHKRKDYNPVSKEKLK